MCSTSAESRGWPSSHSASSSRECQSDWRSCSHAHQQVKIGSLDLALGLHAVWISDGATRSTLGPQRKDTSHHSGCPFTARSVTSALDVANHLPWRLVGGLAVLASLISKEFTSLTPHGRLIGLFVLYTPGVTSSDGAGRRGAGSVTCEDRRAQAPHTRVKCDIASLPNHTAEGGVRCGTEAITSQCSSDFTVQKASLSTPPPAPSQLSLLVTPTVHSTEYSIL